MSEALTIPSNKLQPLREVGDDLAKTGRRLWLAGLGAAGTVGETGWKVASDLVERGRTYQRRERPAIERRLRAGRERFESLTRATERRIEERVTDAMHRFGVPSREDVRELIERIEELTRKVDALSAKS